MSYDFYTTFLPKSPTRRDIDDLVSGQLRGQAVPDIAARLALLAGIAAQEDSIEGPKAKDNLKNYVISGDRKRGGGYKSLVHHKQGHPAETSYAKELIALRLASMESTGLLPSAPDLSTLPRGSWFLQFTFTLAKPWMSKDDEPFYVAESVNPVRKDKVFKVPVMAASSWKGLLRWTAVHTRLAQPVIASGAKQSPSSFALERFVQTLLFGDEKGEGDDGSRALAAYLDKLPPKERQKEARWEYERLLRRYFDLDDDADLPSHRGRLFFYPTFFDRIDVEVINPHSRETRAGRQPVYLECVPDGASGTFSLLYIPFDRVGKNEAETRRQAAEDLQRVAEALQAMFLTYGFSAKRSSGYGVAQSLLKDGCLRFNFEDVAPAPQAGQPARQENLPRYLAAPGQLKVEYLNPDGTFRERSPQELNAMKKKARQQYEKARKWWEREGKALQTIAEAPAPEELPSPHIERQFTSFEELREIANTLAVVLTAGGAA